MRRLLNIYGKCFYKPAEAFQGMLAGNYFRDGFLYMLIPLILYTLMYFMLNYGHGAPSTFTPWLNISKENYYFYNQFLIAPSLILSWFAAASTIQVISRALKGKGSFEATLAILGLSISVAMWSTLIHDLVMSFSSATGIVNAKDHEIAMNSPTIWRTILWICFTIYFLAFIYLFYKSVRIVHKLSKASSLIIGTIGFFLFQLIFLIFNR